MIELTWVDTLPQESLDALDRALSRWAGTPYRVGQSTPGKGVDCVRFVCSVLDELTGRQTDLRLMPQDTAMHSRASAILTMKRIKTLYMPNVLVEDGTVEPGDLLVTAPVGGGPGHAMIAGVRKWHIWESTLDGVHRVGLSGLSGGAGWKLAYVYRILNKHTWGR